MRSIDYARTPPEAPKALVLVVHFTVVIMGWNLCARAGVASTGFASENSCVPPVEPDGIVTQ
jgi:hypothetical protein